MNFIVNLIKLKLQKQKILTFERIQNLISFIFTGCSLYQSKGIKVAHVLNQDISYLNTKISSIPVRHCVIK